MKIVKKVIKILAFVLLGIILLNVMLFAAFSIPSVQKYAADFALDKLKPKLKTEMSIDKIRIRLFNRVEIGGLYVEDQKKDTLLYAETLSARVNVWNLLDNQLSIEAVRLDNFTGKIHRETPETPFNFQFVIDAFAPTDTIKKTSTKAPMKISITDVKLSRGTFRYDVFSEPETPGSFNANHFFVQNFHLHADVPSLDMKNLSAEVSALTLTERQSGIRVKKLEAKVTSDDSELRSNHMKLVVNNTRFEVSDALYNLSTKEFRLKAKSDNIDMKDAAIFYDKLAHLDKSLSFDTDLSGRIPQVDIGYFSAHYGSDTEISIKGAISDFTKYDTADLNVDIPRFRISSADLEDFIKIGGDDSAVPFQLDSIQSIDLKLNASGRFKDFGYTANIKTAPGQISSTGKVSINKDFSKISVTGNVVSDNLLVAKIIGEGIGVDDISLNTQVHVDIDKSRPIIVSAKGNIASVVYKGYRYRDIYVDGFYGGNNIQGYVFTDTEDNKLELKADLVLGNNNMKIDIDGVIDRLYISPVIQVEQWKKPYLTARIVANLQGRDIDNLVGTMVMDSVSLQDSNFVYNPGAIYLQASAADSLGGDKKIEIYSSVLEGSISGNYHFADIGTEMAVLLHRHLPTLVPEPEKIPETLKNNFKFDITLKSTEDLSYAFSLPFVNVEPASLHGTVDMAKGESVMLNATIPRLMLGNNDVRGTTLEMQSRDAGGMFLNLNSYLVQDGGHINARLNTNVLNDSVSNRLFFDVQNEAAKSNGMLSINIGFDKADNDELKASVSILPTDLLFNGALINVLPAFIVYQKDSVSVTGFGLEQDGMLLLGVDGIASKNRSDSIRAYFNNTEIEGMLTSFEFNSIKGSLNGGVTVHQALYQPLITTDGLRIENIRTETDTLGTLSVAGNWDVANSGGLTVNADLTKGNVRYLNITGFVPTGNEEEMNVDLSIKELPLAFVQPFALSAFSKLSGTVSSEINLSGKTDALKTNGWFGINDGVMTVDFTNATYKISDTINISPNNIGFKNLIITDNNNHQARLNVSLNHSNFGGMTYSVNMYLDDFLLLNNEKNTDRIAYGTLKLSGELNLRGSSTGIYGMANLRNESRSNIMIELPQTAQAAEYSGVVYLNNPQEEDSLAFLRKNENAPARMNTSLPINIQGILDINPLLQAGVIINPSTGDALDVNGKGKISFNFDTNSDPSFRLRGDYVVEEGNFKYNFQGLRTIDFDIREGSTVTLVGDPLNTQFNIVAYNEVTADLVALSESFKTQMTNTRVPVNAVLEIQGNMERMNLKYGIELPDASSDVRQRFNSFISTDEQKIRQFGYLILVGSFYSSEATTNLAFNSGMFTNQAFSALTKGLDALFAGALNDNWSINTNLESENGNTDYMRMGVGVSTRLLDNRLKITTNLSYSEYSITANQQSFLGEFELEYDINNWLMIRAYNRANERFYKRAPATQGAGLVITRDTRKFKDLFKYSFLKKEEEGKTKR